MSSLAGIVICVIVATFDKRSEFIIHFKSNTKFLTFRSIAKSASMGAVHGVYLKYVGLSALSLAGCGSLVRYYPIGDGRDGTLDSIKPGASSTLSDTTGAIKDSTVLPTSTAFIGVSKGTLLENIPFDALNDSPMQFFKHIALWTLAYSGFINGGIAVGFLLRRGMRWIGKNTETGQIPLWSYIVYFPFYIPTIAYTYLHSKLGRHMISHKDGTRSLSTVPVASEILPGWWLGGRYSHCLDRKWDGIIDLTVEFPEFATCDKYLCVPLWDGVPPTPAQLEHAACFAADCYFDDDNNDDNSCDRRPHGDVLIHCAHGRGRSTTVMCAALVKTQLFPTWEAAFEAIKVGRPVVKLNGKMRQALTEWQTTYVERLEKKEK